VSHEGYKAYLRNQRVLHPELHLSGAAKEKEGPGTGAGVVDNLKKVVGMKGEQGPVGADGTTTATTMSGVLVPGRVPALEDYRAVMAQRAVFQSVASMGLPALTIHSVVKYTGKALKDAKNKNIRTYAPIGVSIF
jgi:fission process protein 1